MNLQKLPRELIAVPSWCIWRQETRDNGELTKVPYNPITNFGAQSNNASTWVAFDVAANAYMQGGATGLGFFLNSDYVFIDLDDPYGKRADGSPKHADPAAVAAIHVEVMKRFAGTYMEVSPSGRGLHIITKGVLPAGRRRNGVEMYSHGRFMTMTGNVYADAPIIEMQDAIDWLYKEMGGDADLVTTFEGEYTDRESDQAVINRALKAANGAFFLDLAEGRWQQHYGSQSEADFAFIDILAYYTKSVWQINRIFLLSALGKRDKAQRFNGYVMPMIKRSFDNQPPAVDVEAVKAVIDRQFGEWAEQARLVGTNATAVGQQTARVPQLAAPSAAQGEGVQPSNTGEPIAPPPAPGNPYRKAIPGLLGQIAYFVYQYSPRPVPEVALAAAIGLMSGICGRSFNTPTNSGLNFYTLLLAKTGSGKEAIASGINRLINEVAAVGDGKGNTPAAWQFVGPTRWASGQALVKHIANNSPSFVSVIGEFDNSLKAWTDKKASGPLMMLREVILDVFGKSGIHQVLGVSAYSQKENNTEKLHAPAYSMVGEGTPERFYELLNHEMIADGMLPRMMVIEYEGGRVETNVNAANHKPSTALIAAIASLCALSLHHIKNGTAVTVGWTPEAAALLNQFDKTCDGIMNHGNELTAQLYNRTHLKAIRLASLIAVGVNWSNPVIELAHAEQAIAMVKYDTEKLHARFAAGDIGEGDNKQLTDMKRKIVAYYEKCTQHAAAGYGITASAFDGRLFNYTYLRAACSNLTSFSKDRLGVTIAVRKTVQTLIETGVIVQIGDTNELAKHGLTNSKVHFYTVPNPNLLK